ncbi:hypothetical protein [Azotobacter beijerinckii]|uniref:hypothetical protein n=1 Tax=Azotobacter beijerinckii TaxID=170623 RepID=UPI0029543F53|nr:hypothetical protein [Azotobacter beijerinckii]MDV7209937.1 hypothetical protein [Azotobacter beijerinckii]
MVELNYDALSEQAKRRIEALAANRGWSIDQALEEIAMEGIAMGGLTIAGRPKAEVVPIGAKRAQERASKGAEEGKS